MEVKKNNPLTIFNKEKRVRFGQGFTLIEVVVVMAIIAILAVLVVSAIIVARRAAANSKLRNDASKTIMPALEKYYGDHGSKYPDNDGAGISRISAYQLMEPGQPLEEDISDPPVNTSNVAGADICYSANMNNWPSYYLWIVSEDTAKQGYRCSSGFGASGVEGDKLRQGNKTF